MGERDNQQKDPAKHHSSLASQASLSGREESGSSVPVGRADSRLHARVASSFLPKAAVLLPLLCFIAAVALFRSVF